MENFENSKIHGAANQFEFLYFCDKMRNVENCVEIFHILSFVVIVFGQNLSSRIFILQFNFMVFLWWLLFFYDLSILSYLIIAYYQSCTSSLQGRLLHKYQGGNGNQIFKISLVFFQTSKRLLIEFTFYVTTARLAHYTE